MDEARQWFLQGLSAHVFALEAARPALIRGEPAAAPSIQRVARSLADCARRAGYPAIVRTAIAAAENASQPESLDALLASVRGLANERDGEKVHLLVVDDDPVSRQFIDATLDSPNRQMHICGTLAEAEQALKDHEISLLILDLALPDGDGRTLMVRLRQRARYAGLPIVVVTAASGTQARTECFALGADEVIGKPFDPRSLAACVAAKLQRAADLTRSVRVDTLTGLPNQAALIRAFDRHRDAARANRRPLCVGVIRADRLKWTNDTFGTAAGDAVLQAAATHLAGIQREGDVIGRWGGEEFLILMPDATESAAARWLEHALAGLRGLVVVAPDGRTFRAPFTAGLAEAPPEAGGPPDADSGAGPLLLWLVRIAGHHAVAVDGRDASRARRVLLAEDDAPMAQVLSGLLRLDGFEVAHVTGGREVLELAPRETPGLVMLDVALPGLDGFEVIRELRRMPGYDRLPIMIVSGARESREVARGLELGADDYVLKPFSPVELRARVRRLVARR